MSRRSLALKRSCIVKSLFKGNKFQYTITNQPQHIKYKQYKPHIEGMQAHYKYSLHMCPSARSSVPHFVKIASPLFKTYYLERTWKANGWHWDLNFEIRGHQKYPHHIDNPHRQPSQFTRIRVCKRHDQIQGAPHWKTMLPAWSSKLSTDCLPLRRADNHQGVLDVAGRPSPAIYNFQTQLLNIITWQSLLSSDLNAWHSASRPWDSTHQSRWAQTR